MSKILNSKIIDGIPEIQCHELYDYIKDPKALAGQAVKLIDVRRPDEFNAELGHIEGAQLITLGPELAQFLNSEDKAQEIVFICRSGGRSGSATYESSRMGFTKTMNMNGGMIAWNALKLPLSKLK